MKRILNFGSLNLDTTYFLEHIVRPGETVPAKRLEFCPGGKGLNQSVALVRAGLQVWHAGKIGPDGILLKEILGSNGIDCTYLSESGSVTGKAFIQKEDSGQNSIIAYGGANHEITKADIDAVLADFGPGDILVCQNEISLVPELLDRAYQKQMELVLNPSPMDKAMKQVPLERLTWLVVNEIEGGELAGDPEPEHILSFFQKRYPDLHVLLTLGEQGAVYSGPKGRCSCPAYPVTAADTTAAGDTFLGFFLASVIQGSRIDEALQLASAAGALAVTRVGAIPSIPTSQEVYEFIQEMRV